MAFSENLKNIRIKNDPSFAEKMSELSDRQTPIEKNTTNRKTINKPLQGMLQQAYSPSPYGQNPDVQIPTEEQRPPGFAANLANARRHADKTTPPLQRKAYV